MTFGKRHPCRFIHWFLSTLILFFWFPGQSASQPTKLSDAEIRQRLDTYVAPYLSQKDFSGTVMIARGERIIVAKAYGQADPAQNVKNDITTKFRIASLTKTLTAAAIIILADRGKLKLDDPLNRFFPKFPNAEKITIEQLLLHQSGVGQLDAPEHLEKCYPTDELIREIGRQRPKFPPGTDGRYSNEGYNILAAVIEKISRRSYDEFLQKNIFGPLKMQNSGSLCSRLEGSGAAVGQTAGAVLRSVEKIDFKESLHIGSGSVYSTAPDLVRWLRAVDEKSLFDIEKLSYPYGWGRREYSGKKLIEQSGLVSGYFSYMALYPEENVYIVFLSNIQSGLFGRVARDLNAVVFGGEFSKPQELSDVRIPAEKLADYTGEYRSEEIKIPFYIIARSGNLYLKAGVYPHLRGITPQQEEDEFFYRAEYARIGFQRNRTGQIEKMFMRFGNGDPLIFEKVRKK